MCWTEIQISFLSSEIHTNMFRHPWRNNTHWNSNYLDQVWHDTGFPDAEEKKIDCQPRNIFSENVKFVFWLLPSRHKVLEWSPSDPGCFSPSTSSPRLSRQLSEFLLSWMAGHLDPGERRIWIKMTTQKCRWAKFYGEKNKTSVGVLDRWTALTMFSTFFSPFLPCLYFVL